MRIWSPVKKSNKHIFTQEEIKKIDAFIKNHGITPLPAYGTKELTEYHLKQIEYYNTLSPLERCKYGLQRHKAYKNIISLSDQRKLAKKHQKERAARIKALQEMYYPDVDDTTKPSTKRSA